MKQAFYWVVAFVLVAALGACGQGAEKAAQKTEPAKAGENHAAKEEAPAVQAEQLIWVYEARGSRQCEQGSGISLKDSSAKLTGNGVEVQESRCGVRTDRVYPSACGGPTGDILLHLISGDSLDAALELGFDPADRVEYQHRECDTGGQAKSPTG
ncbi:hypothetical protein [Microbulbifer sp. SAOS-129_SWC]|uniref:hypothetical protein n=1 Tax=Microbulbifer sp. SAOS-129_SWC TaxID=3145235 RepID=UPI0032179CEA